MTSLPEDPDYLMSNEELAEYMQIPLATVRKWPSSGVAPRRIRVGKYVRYRVSDVLKWLDSRYVE